MRISDWSSDVCSSDLIGCCGSSRKLTTSASRHVSSGARGKRADETPALWGRPFGARASEAVKKSWDRPRASRRPLARAPQHEAYCIVPVGKPHTEEARRAVSKGEVFRPIKPGGRLDRKRTRLTSHH